MTYEGEERKKKKGILQTTPKWKNYTSIFTGNINKHELGSPKTHFVRGKHTP